MIYEHAKTTQDIARLLRSHSEPRVIIAPRQSFKTTELLKYAEEQNPNGRFIIVCLNPQLQKQIVKYHWQIFNRLSFADVIAEKLLGNPLGGVDISPPLVLSPSNLHLLKGQRKPVFVDEWYEFDGEARATILDSGLFVASVTS